MAQASFYARLGIASVIAMIPVLSFPQTPPDYTKNCIDPVTNENRCAIRRQPPQTDDKKATRKTQKKQPESTERVPFYLSVPTDAARVLSVGRRQFTVITTVIEKQKSCTFVVRAVPNGDKHSFTVSVADSVNVVVGDLEADFVLTEANYDCDFQVN